MSIFRNTILIINNKFLRKLGLLDLLKEAYEIKVVSTQESGLAYLKKHKVDIVITEVRLKSIDAFQFLNAIKSINKSIGVFIVAEKPTIHDAVMCLKKGGDYFFTESFNKEELMKEVDEFIDLSLGDKNTQSSDNNTDGIIHQDPKMQEIMKTIDHVALTKATVLLLGESGVGKEVLAKTIHKKSLRKDKRFVVINCAAIPENLIESELFGHEKGAFTGANYKKIGKFEQAQGGTVFLDELGELSLDMQVKFLRVIQERQIERIGSSGSIDIDIRIIAATNRDLLKELNQGKFREDLYYRINVVKIRIPPLRERKLEIPAMINLFIQEFSKDYNKQLEIVDIEAMHILVNYSWKGNVRELRNVIERATVVAKRNEKVLMAHHLPSECISSNTFDIDKGKTELTLKEYEKMIIIYTLKQTNGCKSRTADILGINRQTLYNKLKEYDL